MGAFLIYVAETALFTAVFYLFNRLLLSRETFHRFNRAIWLAVIPASLALPFAHINFWSWLEGSSGVISTGEIMISGVVGSEAGTSHLMIAVMWIFAIYCSGAAITLVTKAITYIRMWLYISKAKKNQNDDSSDSLLRECNKIVGCRKVKLIIQDNEMPPFSWMNLIVIAQKDLQENGREILLHELNHIKERDSFDILLSDLFIIFQWFNPASWLLKRSLQQVHEYSVDRAVLNAGTDAKAYQYLLIRKAVGHSFDSMANSFNHSKLKKRITMMQKEKSTKWAYAKCLYALPIAIIAISVLCAPKISAKVSEISSVEFTNNFPQSGDDDTTLMKRAAFGMDENDPLYVVNGIIVNTIDNILPNNIESVSVLKGKAAISSYGDKAKNGVIVITLKDGITLSNANATENNSTTDENAVYVTAYGQKEKETTSQEKQSYNYSEVSDFPKFQEKDINFFSQWVAKNMVYPKEAVSKKEAGRVILQFTVGTDGAIKDVFVLNGATESLNKEAVRVVSSSPNWTPGKKDGKPVEVILTFPVIFQLR